MLKPSSFAIKPTAPSTLTACVALSVVLFYPGQSFQVFVCMSFESSRCTHCCIQQSAPASIEGKQYNNSMLVGFVIRQILEIATYYIVYVLCTCTVKQKEWNEFTEKIHFGANQNVLSQCSFQNAEGNKKKK